MNVVDFQIAFDSINFKKKWVFDMQGRNHQGLSQYRKKKHNTGREKPIDSPGFTFEPTYTPGSTFQRQTAPNKKKETEQ